MFATVQSRKQSAKDRHGATPLGLCIPGHEIALYIVRAIVTDPDDMPTPPLDNGTNDVLVVPAA